MSGREVSSHTSVCRSKADVRVPSCPNRNAGKGRRGWGQCVYDAHPRLFRVGHRYCSILRGLVLVVVVADENVIKPSEFVEAEKSITTRVPLSRLISRIALLSGRPGTRGETRRFAGPARSTASLNTVAVRLPVTSSKYRIAPAAIREDLESERDYAYQSKAATKRTRMWMAARA